MQCEREAKPFLRWAGSKRRFVHRLVAYWRTGYERYVEPFMGAASLFFAVDPPMAILGDINADLAQAFIQVRDKPQAVHSVLASLPQSKEDYYRIRARDPVELDPTERAARFVYLNRFCFNGLHRTNLRGEFNVPYGGAKSGQIPSVHTLSCASRVLAKARIYCQDFEATLEQARGGDFVYMDPPFAVSRRRVFREYHPDSFDVEDIERLAAAMHELDRQGVVFLVSYEACEDASSLVNGWHVRRVTAQRSIAGIAAFRRQAVELLISNRPVA